MRYKEYQLAAEKHLKTCKAILSMLATEKFDKILSNKEREYLLMDTYYLSGYIFESAISYGIYKRAFDYHADVFDEMRSIKDKNEFGRGGAYYHNPPDIKFAFWQNYRDKKHLNQNQVANFYIHGHGFWTNIELLNLILPGNDIPLISNRDDVSLSPDVLASYGLINHWKPEKRYKLESPILSFSQVHQIVSLAEEVYKKITDCVGP